MLPLASGVVGACGSLRPSGRGGWGGGRRSAGAGGGRRGGRQPGSWGKRPEGDLVSPTRRVGAVTRAVAGCWRSRWCGACRVLGQSRFRPVLLCSCTGAAWGAAIVRLATSFGRYGARAGRCPAAGSGGWTAWPQAGGAGVWPQEVGHRGAAPAAEDGAVCGRPAAPGPGRAPPVRSSRLGPPGPVGGANPQTGSPL